MTAESDRPANRVRAAAAELLSSVNADTQFIQIAASTSADHEKRHCIEQTEDKRPHQAITPPSSDKWRGFCCPVPSKPLVSPSVARWGPNRAILV